MPDAAGTVLAVGGHHRADQHVTFDATTTGLLLVIALSTSGVLALVVGWLAFRMARLGREYKAAMGDGKDVFATLAGHDDSLDTLRKDLGTVHNNTELLRELVRNTTSRVAVVRYDAFADMGGAMSFSAALLDEHDNGIVLTSINGRAETRTYAKPIIAGDSEHKLSDDERAAIAAAKAGEREVLAESGGSVRIRRNKKKIAS
ncbi:MAG: hypothetical protein ACI867_000693 [Glaciecola sp.]|jgi:hypothetical protein